MMKYSIGFVLLSQVRCLYTNSPKQIMRRQRLSLNWETSNSRAYLVPNCNPAVIAHAGARGMLCAPGVAAAWCAGAEK